MEKDITKKSAERCRQEEKEGLEEWAYTVADDILFDGDTRWYRQRIAQALMVARGSSYTRPADG